MRNDEAPRSASRSSTYSEMELEPENVLGRVELGNDRVSRLERKHDQSLRLIMKELNRISAELKSLKDPRGAGPTRFPTPRLLQFSGLSDADIKMRGEYITEVSNPRKPYKTRVVVLGSFTDPKTGQTLYRFVKATDGKRLKPRPAVWLSPVPGDWKDPEEEFTDEEDTTSVRPPRP